MIDHSILDRLPRVGKNGPPQIDKIVQIADTSDLEYALTGLLGGAQGCWHRLWSILCMNSLDAPEVTKNGKETEEYIHDELAAQIGRRLLPSEYDLLKRHAEAHADLILKPKWENLNRNAK